MSDPFIGQTMIFAGNFAPVGWAFCNGQLLSISQNDVLYTLIGTTYGGDGVNTFALPNLQGRIAIHAGQSPGNGTYTLGQTGGTETHTLVVTEMPAHTHPMQAFQGQGDQPNLENNYLAQSNQDVSIYTNATPDSSLAAPTLSPAGSSQPHDNMQPFLAMNICICTAGLWPSQG